MAANTIQSRMENTPGAPGDEVHATEDEVAAVLSKEEGRTVTVHEVRRIEFTALRKLRRLLQARGLRLANLLPED